MKARTSLWATLAIAASIGLAGCGGSSDNEETTTTVEPSGPTAEEQIAAANKRADDAEGKLTAAEQAAARKEARELAEVLAKELSIGSVSTTGTVTTRGRTGDTAGLTLKADEDDKTMFSGTRASDKDTFTGQVYSTETDEEKTFGVGEDSLPKGVIFGTTVTGEGVYGAYDASEGEVTFGAGASEGIKADNFPKNAGVKTYAIGERVFDGTLGGVSGTYKCDAGSGSCTATLSSDGVALSDGTWTFTPEDGAKIKVADTDGYLSYGWWLQKNSGGGIEDAGPVLFESADLNGVGAALPGLEGNAVYKRKGGAAGKYAMSPAGNDSEAGHFTADAELTVNFGGSTGGAADSDTVSGKIYNFTTETGDKDWMIALGKSDAFLATEDGDGRTTGDHRFRGLTTWSIEDNKSIERGSYTARLYDEAADYGTSSTAAPDEIGGTFSAEHGDHHMIGAFAATLATTDDGAAE